MVLSTAIYNAHLAVCVPSFDMCLLLFIEEESFVLEMIPKNDASLSLLSNRLMSPMYDDSSEAG